MVVYYRCVVIMLIPLNDSIITSTIQLANKGQLRVAEIKVLNRCWELGLGREDWDMFCRPPNPKICHLVPPTQIPPAFHSLAVVIHLFLFVIFEEVFGHPRSVQQSASIVQWLLPRLTGLSFPGRGERRS